MKDKHPNQPRIREASEVLLALELQARALVSSCKAFDDGERWEALRIATCVYTMVHDASTKQPSLLTTAGLKQGMKFLASGHQISEKNFLISTPLAIAQVSSGGPNPGARYMPRLGELPMDHRWLPFSRWWKDDPIYSAPLYRNTLSRMNLALTLRNKEGGGHYDPKIFDAAYLDMKEKTYWYATNERGEQEPLVDLELVSMRQIGWELISTMKSRNLCPNILT